MVNVGYVGKVRYSVPYYGGYTCLLYRTDHFRQAGVSPPETWQELITVCHTLQRELGMDYPLGISPGAPFPIGTWIWQNDGRILSRDYREVMLDDPEAIGAVRFVHSLVHDHKVVHPDLAKDLSPMKLWGDGKVAMVNFGAWNFNLLSEKYPQWEGKWDIAPLPRGEQYASFYGGQHLMIPKGARHPELAWKFIVLLTRQDMQALMARELGRPPANLRCFEDPEFQRRHPFMTKMKPWMVRGRNYPFAPFFWEIWNEQFTNEVLDVIMTDPDANIERVMKHATIQMQKTADGYWRRHGYFYAGKQITSDNHTSH
jgi:multiple sugar transport system substrate-binding protein